MRRICVILLVGWLAPALACAQSPAPSGAQADQPDVSPPALPTFASNAAGAAGPGVLTVAQARAVVVVRGDAGEGTGFFVRGPYGPAVITNLHVLSANPNIHIFTATDEPVQTLGLLGASDRDLAMVLIRDNNYTYLDLATDVAATVRKGDVVITPGKGEGGGVLLNTKGMVLGVEPGRVEFSNPIFQGNSGGPVFHLKSGKVIAVVTQALKVRAQDDPDKASSSFGYRIDTVPKWDKYDWNQFLHETTFIDHFHDLSRCLDSYLNGAQYEKARVATTDEYGPPNALYYMKNAELVKAASDSRDSERELESLAAADMDAIRKPGSFYAFDQIRAQQEIQYRQALQKEIESLGDPGR